MKAVQLATLDGPDSLSVQEIERPTPGPGEVLIEVAYAGVTFPELLQTRGQYQTKHDLPFTLGSEVSGTVVEAAEGSRYKPGDRVAAIEGKGGYAEYFVAREDSVLPLPDEVPLDAAAGMPMNLLTADFALRVRGRLEEEQTLLVHGAAGGLGAACVQVGLSMGAEVIAVVSTEEKAQTVRELGAQHVVLADGFKDSVKELFPHGVDLVADPVGGDRFTDSLRCLSRYGTLLVLGFTAGSIPEVKVNRLLLNNISVAGVGWGAATVGNRGLIAEQWATMAPALAAGRLNPPIHGVFQPEQAAEAIKSLEDRSVRGKVLIEFKKEA